MVAIAGGLLAAVGVGGAAVWGLTRAVSRTVPIIEADARPVRVKPEDPGGLRVANQDERIFDNARRNGAGAPATAPRLAPEPERPDLAALRQAVAPPRAAPQATPSAIQSAPAADQPGASAPVRPAMVNPSLGQQADHAAAPSVAAAAPPAAVIPPAPAGSPAQAARPTSRVVVQLGAVTSEESARAEWNRLRGRIPELAERQPQILRFDREGQSPMWRIRTGGFPDTATARSFCDSAKAKGAPCAVIGG
jgi:hypothetical protein